MANEEEPLDSAAIPSLIGWMRGTVIELGDIVEPDCESWEEADDSDLFVVPEPSGARVGRVREQSGGRLWRPEQAPSVPRPRCSPAHPS